MNAKPKEQISYVNGFRLNCEDCKSKKFFVFTAKDSKTSTFICAECSNIIHQEVLEVKEDEDDKP